MNLLATRPCSLEYLAEQLGVDTRTIYRYIGTFRESGFVVERIRGTHNYRMVSMSEEAETLGKVVNFSEEEAYIVNSLIEKLDSSNTVKANLKRKLSSIYDSTNVADYVVDGQSGELVRILGEAISRGRAVRLVNYESSHSGSVRDRIVEPVKFTSNYDGVRVYDLEDGKSKTFRISRMDGVQELRQEAVHLGEYRDDPADVFRMSGGRSYHIRLRLSNMAKNLLCEEYPLAEQYVVSAQGPARGRRRKIIIGQDGSVPVSPDRDRAAPTRLSGDTWIFDTEIFGLQGAGRFVAGLIGEIEILSGAELKEYVRDYLSRGLASLQE